MTHIVHTLRSPFNYLGGKSKLAEWIIGFMPPHDCYCEPFGGSASILLAKPSVNVEVYNDLNGDLVNFFLTLRDHRYELIEKIWLTPFARSLYQQWMQEWKDGTPLDPIERSARWFFLQRGSFSGKFGAGFGASKLRRSGFWSATDRLYEVADRLRDVVIEQLPWQDCFRRYDSPKTLFFCDPPYLGAETINETYRTEPIDHTELSTLLHQCKGKVLLTHGAHEQIGQLYHDWHREIREVALDAEGVVEEHAERGTRIEWLMTNYPANRLF